MRALDVCKVSSAGAEGECSSSATAGSRCWYSSQRATAAAVRLDDRFDRAAAVSLSRNASAYLAMDAPYVEVARAFVGDASP